jgi:hypothetical protein
VLLVREVTRMMCVASVMSVMRMRGMVMVPQVTVVASRKGRRGQDGHGQDGGAGSANDFECRRHDSSSCQEAMYRANAGNGSVLSKETRRVAGFVKGLLRVRNLLRFQ